MIKIINDISKFFIHLLSAFGLLWTLIEITDFFGNKELSNNIKELWWIFAIIGILYATYKQIPRQSFKLKVPNRDATIKIQKKDIFKLSGSIIVPVNNKFKINQNGNLLNSNSILSQLVNKFYSNKPKLLQAEVDEILKSDFYQNLRTETKYKIGTVVPITQNNQKFYLLANTKLNKHNRSYCNESIFEQSLNELWVYLSDCGGKENFIIPLLGTGNGRLKTDREIVFKDILLSFLSSLSSRNYADSLTICINRADIIKHNINFSNIIEFAKAKIKFQEYRNSNSTGSNIM